MDGTAGGASGRLDAMLWVGVLLPPVAWLSDLLTSYALVTPACAAHTHLALHVVTAAGATLSLAAVGLAWRALGDVRRRWRDPPDRTLLRERFMGWSGVALGLFFTLATLAMAIPKAVVGACW